MAYLANVKTEHKCTAIVNAWAFDVWGNARDGFDVNDRSCIGRNIEVLATLKISNVPPYPGASTQYKTWPKDSSFNAPILCSFEIPDREIRKAFGKGRIEWEDGEHATIYGRNGKPLGEIEIVGWKE